MSHLPSKNQHIFHPLHAQKTFSLEDLGQGVDQRFAGILDNLTNAFVSLDRQWRVTYINLQAESLLQKTRVELLGKILWEAFPEALGSTFYHKYHEAFEALTSIRFEEFYSPLHKWFEVQAYRSREGMSVYFQDITRHKHVEEELFKLAAIVESSDDAIFSKTLDRIVLSWNTGAERLYGYSALEMIGKSIHTLVPPERRHELEEIMHRLAEGQRIEHFETVSSTKDGRRIDVSITVSPVRDATGKITGASTIAHDITERKQMQEQLRASEQRFRALIEKSSDSFVLLDTNGVLLYVSASTKGLLGYTPDEFVGRSAFELIHTDDLETTVQVLAAIVQEPGKSLRAEFRARHQNGSWRWVEGIGTNLLTDPSVGAIVGNYRQELERAQRYERACSLLFLDLDHFKALNDGYGHTAGDAVLYEFASLIRARLRRIDTVGRWGGEEFVAILPELQANEALVLAEEVRAAVAAHTFSVGGGLHLTCSVGMASCPTHAQEREGLLSAVDHAMYAAKRFGRNQVRAASDPAVLALFPANNSEEGREEVALVGMVEALVTLVEARDYSTGRHSHQVADLVLRLTRVLGLPPSEAQMIALASRLHDVGKVAIPDGVLQKAGRLTEEEWELMRTHPLVGADVVSHIPALRPLAPMIRAHHERWDGQGYPNHLKGEAIPFGARILTVVDAHLAMTVDRPYQKACAPLDALTELCRCAGSQFDPHVVEAATFLLHPPEQSCELPLRK